MLKLKFILPFLIGGFTCFDLNLIYLLGPRIPMTGSNILLYLDGMDKAQAAYALRDLDLLKNIQTSTDTLTKITSLVKRRQFILFEHYKTLHPNIQPYQTRLAECLLHIHDANCPSGCASPLYEGTQDIASGLTDGRSSKEILAEKTKIAKLEFIRRHNAFIKIFKLPVAEDK